MKQFLLRFAFPRACWASETRLGWDCPNSYVNELRSEIAAPFTTARLGLPVFADMEKLPNHNKHLNRWVKAMNADPTLIFEVADSASDGVEYLLSATKAATA
jgi:antirestriction protein ArdC